MKPLSHLILTLIISFSQIAQAESAQVYTGFTPNGESCTLLIGERRDSANTLSVRTNQTQLNYQGSLRKLDQTGTASKVQLKDYQRYFYGFKGVQTEVFIQLNPDQEITALNITLSEASLFWYWYWYYWWRYFEGLLQI